MRSLLLLNNNINNIAILVSAVHFLIVFFPYSFPFIFDGNCREIIIISRAISLFCNIFYNKFSFHKFASFYFLFSIMVSKKLIINAENRD